MLHMYLLLWPETLTYYDNLLFVFSFLIFFFVDHTSPSWLEFG